MAAVVIHLNLTSLGKAYTSVQILFPCDYHHCIHCLYKLLKHCLAFIHRIQMAAEGMTGAETDRLLTDQLV